MPEMITTQPLMTFIMEWEHLIYFRMAQRYSTSGDAYAQRYNEIISHSSQSENCGCCSTLRPQHRGCIQSHIWVPIMLCKNGFVLNRNNLPRCSSVWGALNNTIRSHIFWKDAKCNYKIPNSKKYHWCQLLVWASKPSSLGIFCKTYNFILFFSHILEHQWFH